MFSNFIAMNTGEFDKIIKVDGDAGQKTQQTLAGFGQGDIPKYNKENTLDENTQTLIKNTAITWAKNFSKSSQRIRNYINDSSTPEEMQLLEKDIRFLKEAMSINADSMWFTYRTIRHFLNHHEKTNEIAELDEAFMDYVSRNEWQDGDWNQKSEKIFTIFENYTNKEILIEKFTLKSSDNNALFFIKYLSQWLTLLNNYAVHTGFSPDLYSAGSLTTNETNTFGRGVTNVYTECLNSETCG